MKLSKILFLFSIVLLVSSCGDKQNIIRLLPSNNLNSVDSTIKVNTAKDEVAPITRPGAIPNYASPYTREMKLQKVEVNEIISASSLTKVDFNLKNSDAQAYNYLSQNVESLTFIDKENGFVAFSHPPTEEYAKYAHLPLKGIKGGTDIFEFNSKDNVKMELTGLDSINTEFWESHPFAADTIMKDKFGKTKKVTILLWASDRDFPFLKKVTLKKDTVKIGGTDIFYAFKEDGKDWTSPRKLEFGISTKENNEYSPFVYCLCGESQTLFFSSDRDKTYSNDFDIYYTRIKINFEKKIIEQDGQVTAFAKADQARANGKKEEVKAEINSSSDDRFPYVPYPYTKENAQYLYLTSNRNAVPFTWNQDTNLVNVGGYDLYRFPLDSNIFDCTPRKDSIPPPPKLFVKIKINEYDVTTAGDTIVRNLDVVSNYNFATIEKDSIGEKELSRTINQTNQVYEIKTGANYLATRENKTLSCETMNVMPISFSTPRYIEQNDTITGEINCYFSKKDPTFAENSTSKGIAMFVTGYWWPITSDNLEVFKEKGKTSALKSSNFIDFEDYEFYGAVATKNDEWFENYYTSIEEMLGKIDPCFNQQQIVINVHGFTDPCRLRQTANNEFTKFSSDGEITFNDVVIPAGTDMKNPSLKTTSGQDWKLPVPSQNGNAMLALLRAYYTKETIDKGIRKRLANNKELLNRYEKSVNYQMDFFGIYDNDDCPSIAKNIVSMDFPNKPANPEACNLPYSRRVMIYTDLVPALPNNVKLKHERCGDKYFESTMLVGNNEKTIRDNRISDVAKRVITNSTGKENIEKDNEALISYYGTKNGIPTPKLMADLKAGKKSTPVVAKKAEVKQEEETNLVPTVKKEIQIKFDDYGMGCPGPCYWIEFGAFDTEDEFAFAQALIQSFGYKDCRRDPTTRKDGKIGLISGVKDNRPEVQNDLKEFETYIKTRLNKYIEVGKFKFKVMPLREVEEETSLK